MYALIRLFQCLSFLLLILFTSTYALPRFTRPKIRDNNSSNTTLNNATKTSQDKEFRTLYYTQTLDHFNYQPESYRTFKQKYVINFKYWGGSKSNSPILVYLGDESTLDETTVDALVLKDYGQHFKVLLLYIEHRFYGDSIPFGMSKKEVMKNATIRGYFSSAQAIADYAELILHVKEKLNAHYSPVIVFGGSYGGMLAAWFRLKYPHIALGALASSAPVLFFDNIISPKHGFYSVISRDFKTCSEMVMPLAFGTSEDSMFPQRTFNLSNYEKKCKEKYVVSPRPHWITTYYGGHDFKLILRRFGSNIIFSNGLRDPYSSAGVQEDLSDTLLAVYTENGFHTMDMIKHLANDPEWLVHQRKREVQIIDGWIMKYNVDLKA